MKKTLALLLTLTMLFTMVLPVGAFGFETVETVAEELPAAVQSEPEAAALAAEVIPGSNLFTGTKALLTFDDESEADIFSPKEGLFTKSIVENPTSLVDETVTLDPDGKYGKMLQFHRAANPGKHWAGYTIAQSFDGTRNYWITWDEYWDMKDLSTLWAVFIGFNGGNHQDLYLDKANNTWRHFSNIYTPKCGNIDLQSKSSNVELVGDQSNPTVPLNWYLDNYGFYPYYKITYVYPDSTTVIDQVLFADGAEKTPENILTEYTIKTDNLPAPFTKNGKIYNCIGWSTEMNSDTPLASVGLENADVTLYPVLQETPILTADKYVIVANSGVANITANEEVSWGYTIVGADDANVTTAQTSATVTAGKENGTVKLSATLVSDPTVTAEIEILVVGSSNWRPGMNLFTGTEKALDFETFAENDEALYAIFNKGENLNIYDNATTKNGVNYSDKAMTQGAAGGYPAIWTKDIAPTISTDRPLLIEYDYRGKFGNHWMMINGSGAQDIFKNVKGDNVYPATETWKHVRLENQKNEAANKYHEIKKLAIEIGDGSDIYICVDNIRYVPYYQITYKNFDDSVAKTEYVLLDDSGNFMTTYTPDISVVAGAVAYSLEKNGDAVETVELKNKDITLYPLKTLSGPITYTDGTSSKQDKPDYTMDYTVPSLADLGLEAEHFLAWVTGAGKVFKPGDVVKAADIDTIKGMTLTAFCQDLTQPAMGYAYEGDKALGFAKYNYQEVIEDEGRTVNHFRLFANTYEDSQWKNDARFHLRKDEGFDASEYNIVQYSYKIGSSINVTSVTAPKEPTADQLTGEIANPPITIYCMYNVNTFYGSGGTMTIGSDAVSKLVNDKQYHVVELDMSTSEHQTSSRLWTGGEAGKLYGFAVDMNRAYYSADTYVDYFRVYRDGIFTVNYNTNVPEGLEDAGLSQTDVAPDTGRGGGVGYLLKGEQPSLEGFTFRGWALKPDATPEETVTAIDLTGDTTVYAVWTEEITSPNVDKNNIGIRSGADKVNGIRFSSSVAVGDRNKLEEYGFIIAREDVLGSKELTFDFKAEGKNKPLYVYGAAYDKKNGIDYQYDNTGSKIVFTAVCTNIPAEHYATKLVARTYAKYSVGGSAFTVYGSSVTNSIKEIAQSIKDEGGAAYEENKDYIDSILNA